MNNRTPDFSVLRLPKVSLALWLCAITVPTVAQTRLSATKPDALLTIDMNRVAVVERIVEQWKGELGELSATSFKDKLMKLRADQLMAANLSGSFDAVLERLAAPAEPHATPSPADAARAGVVDADGLERLVRQESLSVNHRKALGEIDKDLVYTPIAPCNLMDTRPGVSPVPPVGGPALASGYAVRTVQVTGRCTIPTGAKGIAALYTIEKIPSSGGVVFAGDAGGTGGAVVSWSAPSQYSSGAGITPLSTAGAMQLQSGGATHIKVDVTGYFMPPSRNGNGLRVIPYPSDPARPNVINGSNTNGINNSSGLMQSATISGGLGNIVGDATGNNGWNGTISGGVNNRVTGDYGTVPGGAENTAGPFSFAAGRRAKATNSGSFVWADSQDADYSSTTDNSFNVRANGGVRLNTNTNMFFGAQTRQMLNLLGAQVGIGVQTNTLYYRTNGNHVWFLGGVHNDAVGDPGAGGSPMMALLPAPAPGTAGSGALYAQSFNPTSDREAKSAFKAINPRAVLDKLVSLPLATWSYKNDLTTRHIGPVAQDFKKAFGLKGSSDKSIATVDADGVAFAAIQGLNQKLVAESKSKDAKISALEKANEAMQRELTAIKRKLGL